MAKLLNSLPIGAKVKFGKYSVSGGAAQPIVWMIVAKNHVSTPAYPTNSVTLLTDKIIDAFALDAREPQNPSSDITNHGNAEYKYSNIDQWLNKDSSSGNWYVAAHSTDQSPTDEYVGEGRGYVNRAGFLNSFSDYEKNAILNTTIRTQNANKTSHSDLERKVFLPSTIELGRTNLNFGEGAVWEYFNVSIEDSNRAYWSCQMTSTLYNDTTLSSKPSSITAGYRWWTRSNYSTHMTWYLMDNGTCTGVTSMSQVGIRPAINLSTSLLISDTTDSEGCYTFVWNTAPNNPSNVIVPTIYGGKSNYISWTKADDPDGDVMTYQLECSINGGSYEKIYEGVALGYAHLVPFGKSTVSYRVKATDPSGESSDYTTSTTVIVVNNYAPTISGSDTNLGVKSEGFTGTYTITDANSDAVTVTEAIDGVRIRSLVATLGQANTYGITENTWLALPNGSHTLTISATDGIDTTVRTIVFTKLVDSFSIRNSTPWVSSTMPSRIMVVVTRNIPSTSTFKVEVCNNGYDTSPTWEDATDAVMSGLVHVFNNKTKTATDWGVLVRVTVERNGATGACYVSAIGGNFE